MKRLSASVRHWIDTRGKATDRERAAFTADKCRFWIECWETVKAANGRWLTARDLMDATGGSQRQCRRMLLRLAATGLCELHEARPDAATIGHEIRLRKAQ